MMPAHQLDEDRAVFEQGGICLRGERAKRFLNALYEVAHAAESLESSIPLLGEGGPGRREIDPRYAVKSFAEYTSRRLTLLMNAVVNEDLLSDPLPPNDEDERSEVEQ